MASIKSISVALLFIFSGIIIGCSSSSQFKGRPDHIVIVIEENHSFKQIVNNPSAPYINSLIKEGLLFTDAHGVAHPSQPNYIALFSGSTQGVINDNCTKKETPYTTPNLGHSLIAHGFTFAGYSETMPEDGFTGCNKGKSKFPYGSPLYARKHNGWVDWQGNAPNGIPPSTNLKFIDFPTDFSKLPTVAFVVPNEDNEMHNGSDSLTIKRGDNWLKNNMSAYIQWAKKHNSLFILTYDEDNFMQANHIPTLFVGPMVKSGRSNIHIDRYNVLRTIEKMYGLPPAGPATEKPIAGIWNWKE